MKSIIRPEDFNLSNYNFDSAYFVLATPGQIIPSIFDNRGNICFINFPFKEAIKTPSYIQKTGKKPAKQILEEIQSLISPKIKINPDGYFAHVIIGLFNELRVNDTILLKTSGLSSESIVELMRLSMEITGISNHKKIFIIDVSNISSNQELDITIYKIDQQLIDEVVAKGPNNFTDRKAESVFPSSNLFKS